MNLRSFFEKLIYGKYDNKYLKIALFPLFLLSLLFGVIVQIRRRLYQIGVFESKGLSCKVISVGNISLGGSGKTPTTYYVAKLLKENDIRVGVLSRGYKSKGNRKINLVSDGDHVLLGLRESGDEPYMLAKKLEGVPVLASKDRYRLGQYAISRFNSRALILDDGFQHIRLNRDLDILLVDSRVMSGRNHLFPRGILREPLKNIKRADVFLITRVKDPEECKELGLVIRRIKEDAEIFCGNLRAKDLIDQSGERKGLDYLRGKRVLAFSGIANPEYFTTSLKALGAIVVEELIFSDHHWYSSKDYKRIEESLKKVNLGVTTEKDMVKLDRSFLDNLEIFALSIELCVDKEEEFKELLLARVGEAYLNEQEYSCIHGSRRDHM